MKSKKEIVSELIMILLEWGIKRKDIAEELDIAESTLWRYEQGKIGNIHRSKINGLNKMIRRIK